MTGIENSIAIKELIEKIEKVNDPKVEKILCQLTKEMIQLKLDSSEKEKQIKTRQDAIHDLKKESRKIRDT